MKCIKDANLGIPFRNLYSYPPYYIAIFPNKIASDLGN